MLFKRFLIWSSGDPPVQWSQPIYAILKEGIMGNIHVKLYEIRTSGSGGVYKRTYALTVGYFLGTYSVRKCSQESVSTQQIPVKFYGINLMTDKDQTQ